MIDMSSGYSHQDWNTVVFNKKKQDTQIKQRSVHGGATVSTVANKPAWKIEQQVDSDMGKPVQYVSKKDATEIIQKRVTCKLSQSQLATKLNLSCDVIKDIESCKAVENKSVLSRIKRELDRMITQVSQTQK